MIKERFYTSPSSIGSYFGVGFNSPEEQIKIDLGLEEAYFDDSTEDRMLLGRIFENPTLDYFENKFSVIISERNDTDFIFYNGKMKGKIDGITTINGERTVVECKISNSQSYKFTESLGYIFQVQAYMLATETKQALLCGIYQGKPIYKIIKRDEDMIKDIKRMTDFICDVLSGIESFENYPQDLLAKYSKTKLLPQIEELDERSIDDARLLLVLKEQAKDIQKQIDEIEINLKDKFDEGIFENDLFKITLKTNYRTGGYDLDKLSLEHPEIDFAKYKKPDTSYKYFRLTPKRNK